MSVIWRLITHNTDPEGALAWTRRNGRIAIGWGAIGDIEKRGYNSSDLIGKAIREHYPHDHNSGFGGPSLWNLYDGMEIGDYAILSTAKARVLVVKVSGNYEYVAESPLNGDYNHQRRVVPTTLDPNKLWHEAGARPAPGQTIRLTLIKCARPVDVG